MSTALDVLQQKVEQALRGARLSDDRELAAVVRDEGHRLVFLLAGLVRATRLYDLDNDALAGPANELAEVLDGLVERLGVVHLVLVEGQAYLNDVRVRVRSLEQEGVDQLAGELGRHEVGGLSFHQRLEASALKQLARAVSGAAEAPAPRSALRLKLAALGNVGLSGRWRFRLREEEQTPERAQAELAWRVVDAVREALGRLSVGWTPNPLPLRRVVISVIDSMAGEPGAARGALAPFAGRPGTSERHLISVCELALLLGRAIGLPEATLSDLGVAALLHDVGYLVTSDPERHALEGARLLLRQRGFSEAKVHRLRCTLEHHPDERPAARGRDEAGLFSRILRVADEYDRLVAPRLRGAPPLAPATALRRMWAQRGSRYDATLLEALARELGQYPPGTPLQLGDGSLAIVTRPAREAARFARPRVRLVRSASGAELASTEEVDLLERPGLSIDRVVEPTEAGEGLVAVACRQALTLA